MSLGTNKEMAENKLILLYIIDKIKKPISNLQITKVILESKFMNYFLLQQFLNELCDSQLLSTSIIEDKTVYTINEKGNQMLDYFQHLIPPGIKSRIDNSIPDFKNYIKNQTLITADYLPESENAYFVTCKVREDNFSLIDLKIMSGTKNDSITICDNWKKYSQEIYSEIIASLIKKRD